jgi:hypothetical protein
VWDSTSDHSTILSWSRRFHQCQDSTEDMELSGRSDTLTMHQQPLLLPFWKKTGLWLETMMQTICIRSYNQKTTSEPAGLGRWSAGTWYDNTRPHIAQNKVLINYKHEVQPHHPNSLDINTPHFSIFPKLNKLPCDQQMHFLKHEYSHDLIYWTDQLQRTIKWYIKITRALGSCCKVWRRLHQRALM